ncbi:type III secretion system protein [Yokenella regensburgei]|uniref:type III secretion system protein n=1 Tax=Yokenella regensburgei TaxID=158877 RepID=UPI001432A3C1|nr:type III secretion system protein [Yokenella regensburgei]QIU89167.1 type III secretion system protein [Yokenella regensburgei]
MSDLIIGAGSSERYLRVQDVQVETKNVVIQEEKRNVQDMSDLAKKEGMLSLMMEKQSLRTDTTHASSAAQKRKGGDIETDTPAKAVKLSVAGEGDANKAERLAASVPGILTSQINITQPNNKSADIGKSDSQSTVSTASSSAVQARSQPAVEGGTDITAADAAGPRFINVVGSMKQLEVSNTITTVMLNAERDANKAAAAATNRSVDAAARAGNKTIEAARQNLNGAITSGALGIAGQGATTATQMKALNKEGTSITKNLKPARNLELGVREHQTAIKSGKDTMVHQNKKLSGDVEATMAHPQAADMHASALKRDTHNSVQLATQKSRITAEYANQGIRSGQGAVEGAFGVSAAEKQKEAELARADRDVNNELANTQSQTAKKAAETNAAIRSMTDTILNANNSAVSSIAERTR